MSVGMILSKQRTPDSHHFENRNSLVSPATQTIYSLLCLINIFRILIDPLNFFMDVTFAGAGVLMLVWEASDRLLRDWRVLQLYQTKIDTYLKFLTVPWGLALFYLYVGTLELLLHPGWSVNCLLGVWWASMAVLNLAVHLEYDVSKPTRIVGEKIRQVARILKDKIDELRGKGAEIESEKKFVRIRNI